MKQKLLVSAACVMLGFSATSFAAGDAAQGQAKSVTCAACHGVDGNSPSDQFPKIAGQHESYILKQLKEFKSGVRSNALMSAQVAGLEEQDMENLAAYFASQTVSEGVADENQVELGKAIYQGGNSATNVPACMACHSANGSGNPAAKFPALAGQHAAYIAAQLTAFREDQRTNDAGSMMRNVAHRMSTKEINAVSQYIAGLK